MEINKADTKKSMKSEFLNHIFRLMYDRLVFIGLLILLYLLRKVNIESWPNGFTRDLDTALSSGHPKDRRKGRYCT